MKPQVAEVLRLLRSHPEGLSQQDAIREIACYRLAARIADLKAEGYAVKAVLVGSNGHRYARYQLMETAQLALAL